MKRVVFAIAMFLGGTEIQAQDPNVLVGLNAPANGIKIKANWPGLNGGWARSFQLVNQNDTEKFISFGALGDINNGVSSFVYGYIGKNYDDTFMTFKPNGHVGIGTTNPSSIFHISSNAPVVKIQNKNEEGTSDSFYGWIGGYDKNGAEMWWLGEGSTSSKQLGLFTNRVGYDLKVFNKGQGITVKGDGKIGIGTETPSGKLEVMGDGVFRATDNTHGLALHVRNTSGTNSFTLRGFTTKGQLKAQNGLHFEMEDELGNTWFHGQNGGRVGIGTKTPGAKLDVNGNINFTASQGVWLTGKTDTGGINSSTQLKTGHYQSLIRQKTASNHVVNLGGIGNVFGFFGFDKNRTSNGFDHSLIMNVDNGFIGVGTIIPTAKLDVNGNINFASSQGIWLTGKTDTGGINSSTQLKAGTYQSLIRQKTASNNVVNIGGIGDVFGFFGFDKNRTINGVDHSLVMNTNSGNIGAGIVEPREKLDVNGSIIVKDGHNLSWGNKYGAGIPTIAANTASGIYFYPNGSTLGATMKIDKAGNVGIGTSTTGTHKLAVEGSIGARKIKVEAFPNWSDFVFEKEYKLPTLKEVENHIKEKGHLKDIPSAVEVKKDGFYLGEMDAKLLQKIEELTLYTIQQEKEIETLKNQKLEIEKVKKENKNLKKRLEKLEKLVNKLL
ncbi:MULTISPECIES: hypothetical protein [unclassified Tenacibaculum]|uniref:hypothetical protein n=1 Tax=unclassified Tenacibaculum TaxID=2635139 RepID=UPI001F325F94|nr:MULTISPECIES: hypothetical protein [unclassified Tenacibaculum]MCF2875536.1 hypothetical protein [Tenacibaculum sp. Cn5-1]MCF2935612.1 hypothetical protein [Tenacibaculum sp. Cn5-34]MCG7512172.1 hypothetical protein [Tenacibaculum sp. Cn5-46]